VVFPRFRAGAQARGRIVLPEIGDERIVEAARRMKEEGIAEAILPDPGGKPTP
jgi:phosphotransacetylase